MSFRSIQIPLQLQQLRSSHHLLGAREAPPDYTTVCKQKAEEEEGGLPSYSQAVLQEMGRGEEEEEVEEGRAGPSREEL